MADQSAPEYISPSYDRLTYIQTYAEDLEAYLAVMLELYLAPPVTADGSNENKAPAGDSNLETATAMVELVNDHIAHIAEVRDKLDGQIELVEQIGDLASRQAEEEAREEGEADPEFMAAIYAAAVMEGVIPSDLFEDIGL